MRSRLLKYMGLYGVLIFASLPLLVPVSIRPQALFLGMCAIWPFLFDTTFTLLLRWRKGENLLQAHRSHLYQRLILARVAESKVTGLEGVSRPPPHSRLDYTALAAKCLEEGK